MPVRSLHSSVLRWPDKHTVETALRAWTQFLKREHPEMVGLAYFGSYARGDWGVGSDLDVIIIVAATDRPFEERGRDFDAGALPVPADVLVYTLEEWRSLSRENPFFRRLEREAVWIYGSPETIPMPGSN